MRLFLTSLCSDTRGATTIEYALICGMIVLVMLGALQGLGGANGGMWGNISSKAIAASTGSGS